MIFKRKSVGVTDSLLRLIEKFLSNRFQRERERERELLNGHMSEWLPIKAVVPQDFILDHFFLIYINGLSDNLL